MKKASFSAILSTFVVCFIFWILLTWTFTVQEIVAGVLVSLVVALFSAKYLIHNKPFHLFNPVKLFTLIFYSCFVFMWELLKANWDVAKRAFSMKINPGIVRIEADVKSEYAQAMLANSITLTPGTITMDIAEEGDKLYYYIHWVDVATTKTDEAGDAIKGTLEKWTRRIWE